MITADPSKELLPHLFRQEYAKMTAVLCCHFGLKHMEIAEDIASDTFLKASESWPINGVPENPAAWLYTVAKNKAKDYFKHLKVFETRVREAVQTDETVTKEPFEFSLQTISDSQLAMIFAVCNPLNTAESQICLALQILCGFSVEEISNAFLSKTETIKKRLHRARTNLRNDQFKLGSLSESEVRSRLETVLKTLYLLFNEGYFSKTNNLIIRKDLCSEAVRLALVLTENPLTNTAETNALLALMCYQSSRLEARTNELGEAILFDEQDQTLWDRQLIERGNYFLVNACKNHHITKYHLEASMAYWHTAPENPNKWHHILQLYNQLLLIAYSPVTALNRMFAYSRVYGCEKAIIETQKINLQENNYYHSLLGFLYTETDPEKAIMHYERSIQLTKSKTEKQTLAKAIEKINTIEKDIQILKNGE